MKRLLRMAARLYPARWREQYGEEFEALLEDSKPHASDAINVLRGALAAHWKYGLRGARLIVASSAAGAVLALAVAFAIPTQYSSRTIFRIESASSMDITQLRDAFQQGLLKVFSRKHLSTVIQQQRLYARQRAQYPIAAVAEEMGRKHLHVYPLKSQPGGQAFLFTFENTDPQDTKATLEQLTLDMNASLPAGIRMQTLEGSSIPQPVSPHRSAIGIAGLLAGAIAGLMAAWLRGRRSIAIDRLP